MSDVKKIEYDQHPKIVKMYNDGLSMIKIAEQFGVHHTAINYILKKYGVKARSNKINSKKYEVNENYFNIIDTEEKASWLGFIYADGYISINTDGRKSFGVSLNIDDKNHLDKLRIALGSTHKIYDYEPSTTGYSKNKYSRLLIWNDKLVSDLIKHGVVEHKSNILLPPNLNTDLIPHFIRGYIDGDGSISKSKEAYRLRILGTQEMLDYMKQYIEGNTICKINKYFKRHENDTVMNIDIGGNKQVLSILDLLYKDVDIYLDRKYERYLELRSKLCRAQ
jgi:hypothetical protein